MQRSAKGKRRPMGNDFHGSETALTTDRTMPPSKRQQNAVGAAKPTGRMVGEQARQLQGLRFSAARCEELAIDAGRHVAALTATSPKLEFNAEPAQFTLLLRAEPGGRGTRR